MLIFHQYESNLLLRNTSLIQMIIKQLILKVFLIATTICASFLLQAANSAEIVASINGENITLSLISKGHELDIYEAEKTLYDLHNSGLRDLLISKLIKLDPNSTGLSEDEYIAKPIIGKAEQWTPREGGDRKTGSYTCQYKTPNGWFDQAHPQLKEEVENAKMTSIASLSKKKN